MNHQNHAHLNRLVKFISSCLQNALTYCTQSTKVFAKDTLIQSPINSFLLLIAKKSASCRNKSQCVSAKLQMLPA